MAVKIEKFASEHGEITLATITNSKGASVVLSSLGAGVTAINVSDSAGNIVNVVTTYADPADFMSDGPCAGKTPGRYANRIANATFQTICMEDLQVSRTVYGTYASKMTKRSRSPA